MRKYFIYSFLAVVLVLVIALVFYIFGSTSLDVSSTHGQLSTKTDFPNATCRKVIQFRFPPVRFYCEEKVDTE
jgi:hypothetical protein